MTPTPETDAYIGEQDEDNMTEGEIAMCELARRLERELNAAKAENEAMREAIREAHAALDGCREDTCELFADRDWWKDEHRCDYSTRWEDMKSRISKADATLTKLQPFITNVSQPSEEHNKA
jgi:SMC interacting uncharacterized protein involved in chromosome segregation